jgi:hypothetical protein
MPTPPGRVSTLIPRFLLSASRNNFCSVSVTGFAAFAGPARITKVILYVYTLVLTILIMMLMSIATVFEPLSAAFAGPRPLWSQTPLPLSL